jgi:hypothetical protein
MLANKAELHLEAKIVQREIMKTFSKIANFCLFLLIVGMGSSSNATVITNTFDPTPDRLITTFNSPYYQMKANEPATNEVQPDYEETARVVQGLARTITALASGQDG